MKIATEDLDDARRCINNQQFRAEHGFRDGPKSTLIPAHAALLHQEVSIVELIMQVKEGSHDKDKD
jgi:hypothetical protein